MFILPLRLHLTLTTPTLPLPARQIKPGRRAREARNTWWQQVLITPEERDVRLFTNRIDVGPLRLQAVLGHDFVVNRTGVRWRVSLPWDPAFKKQQWKTKKGPLEAGMCWDLVQTAPSLEG